MKRTDAAGATVDNKFTDGNPIGGIPATEVEETWLNMIQEELANVVEAAGLVLDDEDDTQLLQAITAIFSSNNALSGTTTNSGNTYALDLTPNLASYGSPYQKRFFVKFNAANTGTATLNIDGLGAKTIKDPAGNDLIENRITANRIAMLVYDGTNLIAYGLNEPFLEMIVADEKTSGTGGGSFTNGAYRTRDLQTVRKNNIPGASLAANQITLPAGQYQIDWVATAYNVDGHRTRLYNVTDAALIGMGVQAKTDPAGGGIGMNVSPGKATLTITATKVIELQHRCITTQASIGFGTSLGFSDVECYSTVKIRKVA